MTKLTIVIPTKNENETLQNLVECLKGQTFQSFEIIVADNSTNPIVDNFCSSNDILCISGGLPSKARNNGAKLVQSPYILFLDADMIIDNNFIENALNKLEKNKLDCISFGFKAKTEKKVLKILHNFCTYYFYITTKLKLTHGIGGAILVKKDVHIAVNGFDEKVLLAEDQDYLKRISKIYKYSFVLNPYVWLNVRRFAKEGVFALSYKYLKIEIYRIFKGEIKNNSIPYFTE